MGNSMHCKDRKNHHNHMCSLLSQGLHKEIKRLSDNPTVECEHCGTKANSIANICAAHLGSKAPNIEGGHGIVSLDDVGKPHAGPGKK